MKKFLLIIILSSQILSAQAFYYPYAPFMTSLANFSALALYPTLYGNNFINQQAFYQPLYGGSYPFTSNIYGQNTLGYNTSYNGARTYGYGNNLGLGSLSNPYLYSNNAGYGLSL